MRAALAQAPDADPGLATRMDAVRNDLEALSLRLQRDPVRGSLNESSVPTIANRVGNVVGGHWSTRMNPTATQQRNIEIAQDDLTDLERDLAALIGGELAAVERALVAAGAPWTPGRVR